MLVVLDASAVAKWFVKEEGSDDMRLLREKIIAGELKAYAPEFILVEMANLIRYAKNATADDARRAVRALEITLHLQDDRSLLDKAVELAFKEGITLCDSLYVTLALNLGVKLITYDKELLSKFKSVALRAGDYFRADVR